MWSDWNRNEISDINQILSLSTTETTRHETVPIQPVQTQPVSNQPVSTQPVTTQPVPTQPAPTQPVSTQTRSKSGAVPISEYFSVFVPDDNFEFQMSDRLAFLIETTLLFSFSRNSF